MHKNDFFLPFIFFSYHSFLLSYLELQIIFPCRDIRPATASLDPRPRHWTRDRDFGPATRDPRLLVKLQRDLGEGMLGMLVQCTKDSYAVLTVEALCVLSCTRTENYLLLTGRHICFKQTTDKKITFSFI